MRKMSKAAKAAAYDALKSERDAFAEYAWHVANRKNWDASDQIDGDRDAHEVTRFDVYGLERAHGGIVVILHYYDGQSTSVNVEYFDTWCEKIRALGYATEYTTALQNARLELMRQVSRVARITDFVAKCRACGKTLTECSASPECSETNNFEHDIPGYAMRIVLERSTS